MTKQIFVNLPVRDLEKSTTFYEALGFIKSEDWSAEHASAMRWSDTIVVMLLTHDFYKTFINGKEIPDTQKVNAALFALSLDSKEAVQTFADTAKQNGGDYYKVDTGISEDMMFGYEVVDPDGHGWEPLWMNPEMTSGR